MMKKSILILFLLLIGLTGFSRIFTITNSGNKFTPASVTISYKDSIFFQIGSMHNVIEVSASIWEVNEASPLPGGFQFPFGGGLLTPSKLTEGTHYYVCEPHVTLGMKGTIIVLGPTSTFQNVPLVSLSLFPNPTHDLLSINISPDLAGSSFSVFDVAGKEVLTGIFNKGENELTVESLYPGIYFLNCNASVRILRRFIKN